MATKTAVDFIPAKFPEAITSDLSKYKVITPTPPTKPQDRTSNDFLSQFKDINEDKNDHGTREPHRIHKSWPENASSLSGLENQGVTCYQNAALQSILHQPAVGVYLQEVLENKHPQINKKSVTYELANLFQKMTSKKSSVFPAKMIRRLDDINPMLSEWQQEDSHEYFMSLISRLQEDSVPKGQKLRSSIIHDIFGGSVEQKVKCLRCQAVSTTSQDFYDLPVYFSKSEETSEYTLEQSVKDFFQPEKIELESGKGKRTQGYECEKCQKATNAIKSIAIDEAPEHLTVHIKRFKMEGTAKKVKDLINYPTILDLTNYKSSQKDENLIYKLSAVVLHEGRTVSSGHYVAYARDVNNKWLLYDDDLKDTADEKDVENNASAYILIYSRLSKKEKPHAKQTNTQEENSLSKTRGSKKSKTDHSKKRKSESQKDKKKRAKAVEDIDEIFKRK